MIQHSGFSTYIHAIPQIRFNFKEVQPKKKFQKCTFTIEEREKVLDPR